MADVAPVLPIVDSNDGKDYSESTNKYLKTLADIVKTVFKRPQQVDKRNKAEDMFYKSFGDLFNIEKRRDKENKKFNLFNLMKMSMGKLLDVGKKSLRALKDSAGFWLDLIMLLGALAIFDPNGAFLTTVINFLTDAFIWVIEAIGKYLPVVLVGIAKQVPKIIDKILEALGRIGESFSKLFFGWAKKLPGGSFFKTLLEFAGWLFSKEGTIGKTIAAVKKFFSLLFDGKIGQAFSSLFTDIVVIVLELGDKIAQLLKAAFNGIFDWLIDAVGGPDSLLGSIFGGIKHVFGAFFDYISATFKAIKDLFTGKISFWQFIKDIGEALWDLLYGIIEGISKAVIGIGKWAWKMLKGLMNALWDFLKKIPGLLWDGIKLQLNQLGQIGSWLWEKIKEGFSGVAGFFKKYLIDPIIEFFQEAKEKVVGGAKNIFSVRGADASAKSRVQFNKLADNLGIAEGDRNSVEDTLKNVGGELKAGKESGKSSEEVIAGLKEKIKKRYSDNPELAAKLEQLIEMSASAFEGSLDKLELGFSGNAKFQNEESTRLLEKLVENSAKGTPPIQPTSSKTTEKIALKR